MTVTATNRRMRCAAVLIAMALVIPIMTLAADPGTMESMPIEAVVDRLMKGDQPEIMAASAEIARRGDKAALRPLVTALRSESVPVRLQASLLLGLLRDERAIGALVQALGDQNQDVAEQAVKSLGGFKAKAREELRKVLDADNPKVGWRAANLLALLKDASGVKQLLNEAEKGSPGEQVQAMTSLAQWLGDARGLPILAKYLTDEEKEVAKKAAEGLSRAIREHPNLAGDVAVLLGKEKDNPRRQLMVSFLGGSELPAVVETLRALLKDPYPGTRAAAISVLGAPSRREPLDFLAVALADPERLVRQTAVRVYGDRREPTAVEPLAKFVRQDPDGLGRDAASSLGKIGKPALPALLALLKDADPRVRVLALRGIADAGDESAFEPVLAATRDPETEVRTWGVTALGRIGTGKSVAPLLGFLGGKDTDLAEAAAGALGDMGPKALPGILAAVERRAPGASTEAAAEVIAGMGFELEAALGGAWKTAGPLGREALVVAVGRIGSDAGLEILAPAVRPPSPESVRVAAARSLGSMHEAGKPLLLEALRDSAGPVRAAAAEALGRSAAEDADTLLIELVAREKGPARKAAIQALGAIGSEKAVPALAGVLRDGDAEDRIMAAAALGDTGNREATPALLGLLGDKDPAVRAAAAFALGELGDPAASAPLQAMLAGGDRAMRAAAAVGLGGAGDESAVGPLIAAAGDSDPAVRAAVLQGLANLVERVDMGEGSLSEEQIGVLIDILLREGRTASWATTILSRVGKAAIPQIASGIERGNAESRQALVAAATGHKDERLVEPLLKVLAEEPPRQLEVLTIGALGKIGDDRALTPLIKRLKSPEATIRGAAAMALGLIGDDRAVGGLMTLMKDPNVDVRKAVGGALERLTGDKCPLLVFSAPFPYFEKIFFGLLVLLLVLPYIRRFIPVVNRRFAAVGAWFNASPRLQWWTAFWLGMGGFALFVYSVYCQLFIYGVEPSQDDFFVNTYLFTFKTLPFFIGGCLLSGVAMKYFSQRWHLPRTMLGACTLGGILPLCSCGVVPLARAMLSLDIPRRTVIAFLVVTPVINPFVLVLSYGVIGWEYMLWRILGTLFVAVMAGLLIERLVPSEEADQLSNICKFCSSCTSQDQKDSGSGLINGLKLMGMLHRYILIGILMGAAFGAFVPTSLVTGVLGSDILGLVLACVVGVPLYLCTGEEVILLKPLIDLGLPLGHAVAFTIAANGICITSIPVLFGVIGRKATLALSFLFFLLSFIVGYVINLLPRLS